MITLCVVAAVVVAFTVFAGLLVALDCADPKCRRDDCEACRINGWHAPERELLP